MTTKEFKDNSSEYRRTVTVAGKTLEVLDGAAAYKAFFRETNFELSNPCDLDHEDKIAWFKAQPQGFELFAHMQSIYEQGNSLAEPEAWINICQAEGSFPRRNG